MQESVYSQWRFHIGFGPRETTGAAAAKGSQPQVPVVFAAGNNFCTDAGLSDTEKTAKIWT